MVDHSDDNNILSLSSSESSLLQTKDEGLMDNHLQNFSQIQLEDMIDENSRPALVASQNRQDFSFIHKNRIPSPL